MTQTSPTEILSMMRTIELAIVFHRKRNPRLTLRDTAKRLRKRAQGDFKKLLKEWSKHPAALESFNATKLKLQGYY